MNVNDWTYGHCARKKAPGGCQLHNLQCGYPDCDRKRAAAPTPAPVPVDPAELAALRRDAACFQWLMSLQSGRPESQIALAQVILAMRKNPEAVRKFIEGQIALAANGGKVA